MGKQLKNLKIEGRKNNAFNSSVPRSVCHRPGSGGKTHVGAGFTPAQAKSNNCARFIRSIRPHRAGVNPAPTCC